MSDPLFQDKIKSGLSKVTLNKINCLLDDGTLIVQDSDFNGTDKKSWLSIYKERANVNYDRGDTIFVHSIHMAIATPEKALTYHIEDWILNAIKNILQNS